MTRKSLHFAQRLGPNCAELRSRTARYRRMHSASPPCAAWHVKCIAYRQKEKRSVAIQKPRSIKAWAIGAVVLIAVVALAAFQFRGDGGAKAKTVTIAGIAYPFEGGQVYNGLTGVVIRDGW